MELGDRISVAIERLSLGGDGIARHEGRVVFVPYSAPGDRVEIEITELQARHARGRLTALEKSSPQRVMAPCPYHFQPPGTRHPQEDRRVRAGVTDTFFCGGCSWQHLAYAAQLESKRQLVQETFERLGGLNGVPVHPTRGMKDPWRYRNKVQPPVGWDARHERLVIGFYTPSSHAIVPIEDCGVQPKLSTAILQKTRELLEQYRVRAYDETHHQGWIRHLIVRTTGDESQAMLTFVTRAPEFPHESKILPPLVEAFPQLVGIHQNIQPARSNVILGRQWRTIAGQEWMEEHLGRLRFRLSPASFFQINSPQAAVLYDITRELAGKGRRLLDLYCGVGAIALWLADRFEEVGGVEEVDAAVHNAEANAELNGITNARFMAGAVEQFLRQAPPNQGAALTVTLDPPRAGCSSEVVKGLLRLAPQRIVYVSCDPGTLARDLKALAQGGYRVEEAHPVDLFPQTAHIETVVKLTLQK